jgi:nicotinamide phosphoribosyltransferase
MTALLSNLAATILDNPILDTDSYKLSHFRQYPEGTTAVSAYIEARSGGRFDRVLFFGLQMYLKTALARAVTRADIDEAEVIAGTHGLPFNRAGWELLVERHAGFLPIEIEALPEGSIVATGTPLVQVTTTDPDFFWLATYIETALLRAVWYPTTVATLSWHVKQVIGRYLETTSDDPAGQLPFKLHDFGARGVAARDAAGIGGLAHLVNFMGTDTLTALLYARRFYAEPMAGYSIPAAEHSTITAWGPDREVDAYRNMIRQFGGPGKLVAVVSDSTDVYHAVKTYWGETLKREVERMGGTVVVRPDSGDPTVVPIDVVRMLGERFGTTVNGRGYKVLAPCVRVIQGDGVSLESIEVILERLTQAGFAADNIAFGMGGALLQKVDRDTLRFAMKANARMAVGTDGWIGINKTPKTDPGKASKKGRIAVRLVDGKAQWCAASDVAAADNLLRPVWRNGRLLAETTLAEVRARTVKPLV